MLKVLSSLMVVALFCNSALAGTVQAGSEHEKAIAQTFSSFSESMAKGWDSGSPASKSEALAAIKGELALLESRGVTPIEMMDYVRNRILDQESRADFDRLLSAMKDGAISPDAASELAMKFIENSKSTGANFLGGKGGTNPVIIVAGVVIVGAVTYYAIRYILNNGFPFLSMD
jgi:hypothetical protein